MGTLLFKNNASTTLSGSINNSQTAVTVANSGSFPAPTGSDYFYVTMYELSGSTEINVEIVKVTAVSGNNWTIVRAQDGTTARSRDGITTCYVENRYTAASAALHLQKDNNLSDLTSASTARTSLGLGTMATQDASAVAITGGTISGVTINTIDSSTTIADNVDTTKKVAFEVSGVATGTTRTLTVPNANGTIALTSDLTTGYQPLDSDLTALAALAANGLVARTGTGTVAVRAITQPAAGITVTNGDGVSGNPTIGLANDLGAVEALATTGFVRRTGADTWSASALVDADVPGALTGKTYNGLTLTAAATGFTIAGGTTSKTLTVNKTLTLDGTDGTTVTLPATSGTVALNNQTFFIGTTSVAINRASASLSLTGVNIDGSAGSATSATSATTSTNLASGVLGSLPYQSAAATTALLAPNTTATRNFLRMTGTGTVGAAPAWDTVTKTDVGLANVENTALSTWTGTSTITTLGTISTGTWSASTIAVARGGTGQTTAVAAFDALSPLTTLGDTIYHDGADNVRLAGNTTATKKFLRQTGTGTVSAAPAWDTLVDGDIPAALTGKTYNGLTVTTSTGTLTVTNAKTFSVSNTLTLSGTDGSTLNVGTGGTLGTAAYTASSTYAPTAGSANITTLGTIGTGTWQGSAIGITYGGTGATTKAAGFNALSPVTTLGDLIYGDGANSNTRLAGNTAASKRFLTQTGNGTISAAPGWNAIVDGDLPSALTGKTYNGVNLTANATGFSVAGGTTSKTLQVNNNLTLSGTDGSTLNIGAGGTLGSAAYTASTAYQPVDADLTAIAALAGTSGFLKKTAADTWALDTSTYLTGNQSITVSGDASGSGTTAISLTLATVPVSKGGTGVTTLTGLVKGSGTSAFTAASAGTDYQLPIGTISGLAKGNGANALTAAVAGTDYVIPSALLSYAPLANPTFTGTATTPNLAFDTAGGLISGDFSNATASSRVAFRSSTTNGNTIVTAKPNGTATASFFIAHNAADADNSVYGYFGVNNTAAVININKTGTGGTLPFNIINNGFTAMSIDAAGNVAGSDYVLSRMMVKDQGFVYYNSNTTNALDYTNGSHQRWAPATGAQTLSITNWPPSGNLGELLIEGVNLAAATITWPTINWIKSDGTTTTTFSSNGVTLQSSGTDFVFLWTRDAGTTIYGKVVR